MKEHRKFPRQHMRSFTSGDFIQWLTFLFAYQIDIPLVTYLFLHICSICEWTYICGHKTLFNCISHIAPRAIFSSTNLSFWFLFRVAHFERNYIASWYVIHSWTTTMKFANQNFSFNRPLSYANALLFSCSLDIIMLIFVQMSDLSEKKEKHLLFHIPFHIFQLI